MNDSPQRKQFIAWLNDAYAMERSLAKVLENHVNDAKDHEEIRRRDEQHLAETRHHARQVERCLEILGEKPSAVKAAMGTAMGTVQGAATGMFGDEIMKNFISDYAAENMEIACYRSLIAAAEELGEPEIARICGEILKQEEAMSAWLAQRIPAITRMTLQTAGG
jgi:ferritin-like metal-binding protein YciE